MKIGKPNIIPPRPVAIHVTAHDAGTFFSAKRQGWGKIGFAQSGVLEVDVDGQSFLCPPHYATWVPPNALVESRNAQPLRFVSIHIARDMCEAFPPAACTLVLSPLVKAIIADFASRGITLPDSAPDHRLAVVLIDQLQAAERRQSYLPVSDDPLLRPITNALLATPGDPRSLAEWARGMSVTERTLNRRFQTHLDLPFKEWRQRMKLVAALSMLEGGATVADVALRLGYTTPSAFIAMFRRQTGSSPTELAIP